MYVWLSVSLFVCMSGCVSFTVLLSVSLAVCLFVCVAICMFHYIVACLLVCLTMCLSVGKLYAVGGHDGNEHLKSGEVFDAVSNKWKSIAAMSKLRYVSVTVTQYDATPAYRV